MKYCESIRKENKCNKFNPENKKVCPTGCDSKGFCVVEEADACDKFLHDDEYGCEE